jgi:hypothetical protein
MDDGAKKAGVAVGGIVAVLAGLVSRLDDCGRLAARTASSADNVVVTGSRYGDDVVRSGRYGGQSADEVAGLGRAGSSADELSHAGTAGGAAVLDEVAGSGRLTDDGLEALADASLEAAGYAPDLLFADDDDAEEAPSIVMLRADEDTVAAPTSVRVVVLARDRIDGADHGVTTLAGLDMALSSGPPDALDLVVVTTTAYGSRRIQGTWSEPTPSVDAVLARCATLGRACVLLTSDGLDVRRAVELARRAAAAGPVGVLPRLVAERDREALAIGLHRLEASTSVGGRPRVVESRPGW